MFVWVRTKTKGRKWEMKKIAINMFRIKPQVIPKIAYKYRLLKYFDKEEEYYREISKLGGVNLDRESQIFLTLIEVPSSPNEVKLEEKLSFQNLPSSISTEQREQLLAKYLRWSRKVEIILNKSLQRVREEKKIGEFFYQTLCKNRSKIYEWELLFSDQF